jgi:hypothetical protein
MLKSNQIQSLIATTRARINNMHKSIEALNEVLPLLKSMNKSIPIFVEEIEQGEGMKSGIRKDMKRVVELQKALKAELLLARAAEKEAAGKVEKIGGKRIYSIDKDGQPKKNGRYFVLYDGDKTILPSRNFEFRDGVWYHNNGVRQTAFGNGNTEGERYAKMN